MSEPVLQLTVQGNWFQVYDESRSAIPITSTGGHYPIPAWEIPFLLEKHILAVRCFSVTAKANWRFAGTLSQRFQAGTGGSGSPLPVVEAGSVGLRVNRTKLVIFKKYVSDYQLLFENVPWLKDLRVTIWEYRGTEFDSTEELIQATRAKLETLEFKIDNLR
jgi:hypothetical protein